MFLMYLSSKLASSVWHVKTCGFHITARAYEWNMSREAYAFVTLCLEDRTNIINFLPFSHRSPVENSS